jgi:DNA-binding NarL/FixJ family response regulator
MTYPAAPHSHEPLRVAAVDDHIYILNGILWTIQHKAPWIAVIATVATVGELLDGPGAGADVVLLDLDLGHTGFEVEPATNVALIRAAGPQVLILTATEDKPVKIRRAIQAGACGLVLKSDPEEQLIEALTVARTGELVFSGKLAHALITDPSLAAHLAPKELEVFQLLAQGVGRKDIGKMMNPRVQTTVVDTYLKRVAQRYRQLGRPTYNAYETLRHVVMDGHVDLNERDDG